MSVSRRSRYIDGPHNQVKHKYTDVYERTVYRKFPGSVAILYTDYTWVDGERYAGNWHNNQRDGAGKLITKEGEEKTLTYENGSKQ